jgi:hypothetical protein
MLFFLFVLTLIQKGHADFFVVPIESRQVCTLENKLMLPGLFSPIQVTGVGWMLNGPQVSYPLTLNGKMPIRQPDVVCLMGCDNPPCAPSSQCNPADLWWRSEYHNLIVDSGNELVLTSPNGAPPPPTLAVFFSNPSPVPRPTPPPTSTPPPPRPTPPPTPTSLPYTNLSLQQCQTTILTERYYLDNTAALIGLGVTLSVCFCVLMWLAREYIILRQVAQCAYCESTLSKGAILNHLKECKKHLELYDPVIMTRVQIVDICADEKEDQVAQPEATPLTAGV